MKSQFHCHSKAYEKFLKSLLEGTSLNLGCGGFKICDVNLDCNRDVKPDVVWNLDRFRYPVKSQSFRTVLLHHVIEHLEKPRRVLEECKRLLKPGGRIIIAIPSEWNPNYKVMGHRHFFTKMSLKNIVESYFLDVQVFGYRGDTKEINPFLGKIIGFFRPNEYICIGYKAK